MLFTKTGSSVVKIGDGLANVGLLASFVVNYIHWTGPVGACGQPIVLAEPTPEMVKLAKEPGMGGIIKDYQKACLKTWLNANKPAYDELTLDFAKPMGEFVKKHPRGRSKVRV